MTEWWYIGSLIWLYVSGRLLMSIYLATELDNLPAHHRFGISLLWPFIMIGTAIWAAAEAVEWRKK